MKAITKKSSLPLRKMKVPVESGLHLAGQALHIFSRVPLAIQLLYYIGTLPFVLAFLYFWFDMSQSAYAHTRLFLWTALLPLLFIWMKCWHAVYTDTLYNWLYEREQLHYGFRNVMRLIAFTSIIQPLGFILIPISMLLGLPYMTALFFFQDILISGESAKKGLLARCMDSYRASSQHSGQGLSVIWLLSPVQLGAALFTVCGIIFLSKFFGAEAATAGNSTLFLGMVFFMVGIITTLLSPFGLLLGIGLTTLALMIPYLLDSVFGVATIFSHGWMTLILNTSFVTVVYSLVYLLLDPLMKIATVMRRFQFNSRGSGEDILFELKSMHQRSRVTGTLLVILLLAGVVLPLNNSWAQQPESGRTPDIEVVSELSSGGGSGAELDVALDSTLQETRYTWRMPRKLNLEKDESKGLPAWLARYMNKLEDIQEMIKNWLEDLFDRKESELGKRPWAFNLKAGEALFYILLIAVFGILVVMLVRWLRVRRTLMEVNEVVEPKLPVNIHDHSVSAQDLPPDEWLELAATLIASGDYRAAVRALFLGVLATLGELGFVTLRSYKSNRDYRCELELRARRRTDLLDSFNSLSRVMECSWYGYTTVTPEMWRQYKSRCAGLRRECEPDSDRNGAGEDHEY